MAHLCQLHAGEVGLAAARRLRSSALQGWRENGVRECVDAFLTLGLDRSLGSSGIDATSRVLIHGDPRESYLCQHTG